jgi:hypothetical protein
VTIADDDDLHRTLTPAMTSRTPGGPDDGARRWSGLARAAVGDVDRVPGGERRGVLRRLPSPKWWPLNCGSELRLRPQTRGYLPAPAALDARRCGMANAVRDRA